jgi:hypothetical protein
VNTNAPPQQSEAIKPAAMLPATGVALTGSSHDPPFAVDGTSQTALIKANRFIYKNKGKAVEIAAKYTKEDPDVVAQTYDTLVAAGAWSVNEGLPREMVEWTINHQVEVGTIKDDQKPTYEKLIDFSVVEAALAKAGGRWTGDRRWD